MKVYLKQDIQGVGLAGEIIKVSDGYARNYLLPHNKAIHITRANEKEFMSRARVVEKRAEVLSSETSMLAQKISDANVTLKAKAHDDGKLYGSVGPAEVAQALGEQGITVSKSQVQIKKSIKECGTHTVRIKLSSRLQPTCTITVKPE